MSALTLSNPVLQAYIVHSTILTLKLLSMTVLTGVARIAKGVYANPEDINLLGGKVQLDDPTVERTRRAHLNDLENIPAFWVLAGLYVTTGPSAAWAILLFRVYTICRIIHTVVYAVVPLPQPARGIVFDISLVILLYMGVHVVIHYSSAI